MVQKGDPIFRGAEKLAIVTPGQRYLEGDVLKC